ncbi:hypothetical protein SAMN03159386_06051, partial [Pseudomonas sp. NFACC17-2]
MSRTNGIHASFCVALAGPIASKLACMFRLEGVGGTKSSIPTLASTDRGRL